MNNLYFDDESNTLKYIVKEEFKNYRGKDFRLTNLTALNSSIPTSTMRIFTKLIPQYYSYLSGLITEKQFLPVLVSELREYILEVVKLRIVNELEILPYSEYFLEYLSFDYNFDSSSKYSINEFPIDKQKLILEIMKKSSNEDVRNDYLKLYLYLEDKFKGD